MIAGVTLKRGALFALVALLGAASWANVRAQQPQTPIMRFGAQSAGAPLAGPVAGDLAARLERIERQLEALMAERAGNGPGPELETALERLAAQISALKVDQERFQAQVERRLEDLESRARRPSSNGSPAPASARAPAPSQGSLGLAAPVVIDQAPTAPVGLDAPRPNIVTPVAPHLHAPMAPIDDAPSADAETPPPAVVPAQGASTGGGGQADYDAALGLLETGAFDAAFQRFAALSGAPDAGLAGAAQYWVGDIHYRKGEYDLASKSFLESFRRAPEGPKGPDSLLRLGMTLGALGKRNEACVAFTQVGARYPSAPPDLLARARVEAQRNQCP